MMPRLKVCGVTDPAFAAEAARLGVDYVGVIFAERSPRRVDVEAAREIAAAVRAARPESPPKVVGVFVGGSAAQIAQCAVSASLDVVQLHGGQGDDVPMALKGMGLEVWRLADADVHQAMPNAAVDALLLDGRSNGKSGGTGCLADWARVAELKKQGFRVVLAGGLSAANASAAAATGADILDFNSSLETAPGVKSRQKLAELLANVAGSGINVKMGS